MSAVHNMLATIQHLLSKPYTHYALFFSAGAGLELFMNLFHIGEISLYRTIKRNLSTSRAEEQFELEKALYEKIELGGNAET